MSHGDRKPTKIENRVYEHGNRPTAISAPPRNSKHGRVVAEVGVYEEGSGARDYWKVIQRIEDGDKTHIRHGYYACSDDDWSWSRQPLLLPPSVDNELRARAVTQGLLAD